MKHSPWLVVFSTCNTDLSHLRHPVVLLHRPLGCQVHLADENGLWLSSKMLCVCVFCRISSRFIYFYKMRTEYGHEMSLRSSVQSCRAKKCSSGFFFFYTQNVLSALWLQRVTTSSHSCGMWRKVAFGEKRNVFSCSCCFRMEMD